MNQTKNITLTSFFLVLGLLLPFLCGQIQIIGNMLLPMHIPVLLCGLICGYRYGLLLGFILPLVRSFLFTMPIFYPNAIAMAFELATYGFCIGYLFKKAPWQCIKSLYRCLMITMIIGRVVWAFIMILLLGTSQFTFTIFITSSLINAIPGILLQLILIPSIMLLLHKTHLIPFKNQKQTCHI